MAREDLAEDQPDKNAAEPTKAEGEELPINGFIGEETGEALIKGAECGAIGGEITCEGFCAELVTNPADGEIVPVEAKLRREDAVGKRGNSCEDEGRGCDESEEAFHKK